MNLVPGGADRGAEGLWLCYSGARSAQSNIAKAG